MSRRIKQFSVLIFLLAAITNEVSVPLQATDCTAFFSNCNVNPQYPYFTFSCSPGPPSCSQVDDCIEESCPAGSSLNCDPGDAFIGANGWGYCAG